MLWEAGRQFGKFEILGLLGAGGMGEVYRARDPQLGREVALKILPHSLAASPEFRDRFEREGRFLASFNHPHVAAIYGLETDDGVLALALELVSGPMLGEWLAAERRPVGDVLRLAGQVAEALDAAHQRGIVHRDLKPANVRLDDAGRVKVLDFGIAASVHAPSEDSETLTGVTSPGSMVGTPGYLSPEQATGAPVDARSDVWSFGALLFEMLTHRPAFLRASVPETLAATLTGQVIWDLLPPQVPAGVRTLLQDCLSIAPDARPPDGAALAARLSGCATSPPVSVEMEAPSLLVFPFESVRGNDDDAAFADGLTEEVIGDLANIEELRVFSRATAWRFRGERRDGGLAAKELDATYVLDGSVRRSGSNVRVTAQLVRIATDAPIWAQKFAGTLQDVFGIQEEISRSIASALRLKLAANGDRRFADRRHGSAAAYEIYLSVRADIDSFALPRLDRARKRLELAFEELGPDPYLLRGLGQAAWQYINGGFSRADKHFAQLDSCIEQLDAIESGGLHATVLRSLRAHVSGDVGAWYRALEAVEAVDPNEVQTLLWKALVLCWAGRTGQGRAILNDVAEVDPWNEYLRFGRMLLAFLEGRFVDAQRWAQRGLEDYPGSAGWPTLLSQVLGMMGDREAAREVVEQHLDNSNEGGLATLAHVFVAGLFGDQAAVRQLMAPEFSALMWNDFQYGHIVAQSYALLGDTEESIRWVERIIERGFLNSQFLNEFDPILAPLRGDERFRSLMERARRMSDAFPVEGPSSPS